MNGELSFQTGLSTASNEQLSAIVSRPMRTPIACLSCRKSKIKCHHGGVPPCRHCSNTGKECVIPAILNTEDLLGSPAPKRRTQASQIDGSVSSFKKARYDVPGTGLPAEDIVKEAVDIFFQHFYNDAFAFIHQPSFRTQLQESPETIDPVLILAILTLSARFCRLTILKDFENEAAASEYFCKRTLSLLSPSIDKPSLVRIQAFLMVGLHLWGGASQGAAAFIYIGIAIRMIQVLELGSESSYPATSSTTEWIMLEERRRTFWCAYLMDRFLSNGRGRPQTISNADISIPLPADNLNFTYGTPETVLYLNQIPEEGRLLPECTGTHASLIVLVDLWSRMARWSCARKWMTDELAPWDERSEFYKVVALLEQWKDRLPKSLSFNDHATMIQLSQKNSNWALMWIVYHNGLLFMHRSYLTFAPSKQDPKGPREAAERGWIEPPGYWKASADACFLAAEQIILLNQRLVETHNALVTPMALFSIFSAAAIMAYLVAFSWVDVEQKVAPRSRSLFQKAYDYLQSVQTTWRMVANWVDTLGKLADVHAKFARDGRSAHQTEDHFAEFRSKVLDFGNLHQVPESYSQPSRATYNSSIRTGVPPQRSSAISSLLRMDPANNTAASPDRDGAQSSTSTIQASSNTTIDPQPLQSIHEGSLAAFMQGSSWDLMLDEWLSMTNDSLAPTGYMQQNGDSGVRVDSIDY